MASVEKIMEIKKKIETAKEKLSIATGQLQSTTEQMMKKFNVSTVDAAEKLLADKSKKLDQLEEEFEKGCDELEGSYDWDSISLTD